MNGVPHHLAMKLQAPPDDVTATVTTAEIIEAIRLKAHALGFDRAEFALWAANCLQLADEDWEDWKQAGLPDLQHMLMRLGMIEQHRTQPYPAGNSTLMEDLAKQHRVSNWKCLEIITAWTRGSRTDWALACEELRRRFGQVELKSGAVGAAV